MSFFSCIAIKDCYVLEGGAVGWYTPLNALVPLLSLEEVRIRARSRLKSQLQTWTRTGFLWGVKTTAVAGVGIWWRSSEMPEEDSEDVSPNEFMTPRSLLRQLADPKTEALHWGRRGAVEGFFLVRP